MPAIAFLSVCMNSCDCACFPCICMDRLVLAIEFLSVCMDSCDCAYVGSVNQA